MAACFACRVSHAFTPMAFLFVFCTSDLGGGIAASATFFGSFIQDFQILEVECVHPDIMNGEKKSWLKPNPLTPLPCTFQQLR